MRPFVSPISPTWMNSFGSLAKLPINQTANTASRANPNSAVTPDLRSRSSDCISAARHPMENLNESRERS